MRIDALIAEWFPDAVQAKLNKTGVYSDKLDLRVSWLIENIQK